MSVPRQSLAVRMYRVGFGDCFLITLPGPVHVLVDCGSRVEGARLSEITDDLRTRTGGRIHLVIASHRHRDHVSGFASERRAFARLRVDEVWLPWTEDPDDAVADSLRRQHDGIADALAGDDEPVGTLARNSRTKEAAMDTLREGLGGSPRVRYLRAGQRMPPLPGGLHARVLGPARTEEALRRLQLEAGLAWMTLDREALARGPFAPSFRLDPRTARALYRSELRARPVLDEMGSQAREEVAFWLDKTINNTSLVLLLRVGTARLLLPGDAQLDGWLPALLRPELIEELGKVVFYKVSHHGSHNGTPRRALGALRKAALHSMISCDGSDGLPEKTLLDLLKARGKVLRSDGRGISRRASRAPAVDLEIPL